MIAEGVRTMTLGEFVRRRRGVLGLNQGDVVERMGKEYAVNWLSRVEIGRPTPLDPQEVNDLARALECSKTELLQAAGYNLDDVATPAEPWGILDLTDTQQRIVRETIEQFRRANTEHDPSGPK